MSICKNALLKLHQPMILQNFVSCKHLAKLFMIMIVVYNDFLKISSRVYLGEYQTIVSVKLACKTLWLLLEDNIIV